MRKPFPFVAIVLAFLPGCGDHEQTAAVVSAELRPLNASGVEGTAELTLNGDKLDVRIDARGLAPNRVHGQTINGFPDADRRAACPPSGGDGVLRASDAQSEYGPVIRAIEPFPTVGGDGALDYRLTLDIDVTALQPLPRRVLVLHGGEADPDGDGRSRYYPDLPVACGELKSGDVPDRARETREESRRGDGRNVPEPLEDKLD